MKAQTSLKPDKTIDSIFHAKAVRCGNQLRIIVYKLPAKTIDILNLGAVKQMKNLSDYVNTQIDRRAMTCNFTGKEIYSPLPL